MWDWWGCLGGGVYAILTLSCRREPDSLVRSVVDFSVGLVWWYVEGVNVHCVVDPGMSLV